MSDVGPSGVKHLLIVDDEPVILQILKAVFEDEPYRLDDRGLRRNEALKVIEGEGCDLLITDRTCRRTGWISCASRSRRTPSSR
jgi:DNA-binding response OmpR family regulator